MSPSSCNLNLVPGPFSGPALVVQPESVLYLPAGAVFAAEQFTETLELNEVNVEMVLDEVRWGRL